MSLDCSVGCPAASPAASAVRHNVPVNLYMSFPSDFRRKTITILVMKNFFNAHTEEPGGPEGQLQEPAFCLVAKCRVIVLVAE